jgi:aldose 1-epimerase
MFPARSRVFLGCVLVGWLFLLNGCATHTPPKGDRVRSERFGRMPDGSDVAVHTLRNRTGMVVRVMDLGATVIEVSVPDRQGRSTNVVLGAPDLDSYLKGFPGAASVIGRFANRIRNARFDLDGREVRVTANAGMNHIHGGRVGFGSRVWQPTTGTGRDRSFVRFRLRSPDGEEGFPGNMEVEVTYTLTDAGELRLDYVARTDAATVVNLTNHAYFNLAGTGDVLGHDLQILSDAVLVTDDALIPTGPERGVAGTPLDFREPRRIGEGMAAFPNGPRGYDHHFVLREPIGNLRLAARAVDPGSGRVMECLTTQPGVQLYTANHFGGRPGDPVGWKKNPAFCLETQHPPDAPNHRHFPSTTLRPGDEFRSVTVFRFSTRP